MDRQQQFITEVRELNRQVWDGIAKLKAKQREWNALDYGNTLEDGMNNGAITNAGVTRTEVGSVLFDTVNAMEAVLDAGHATNMAKLL